MEQLKKKEKRIISNQNCNYHLKLKPKPLAVIYYNGTHLRGYCHEKALIVDMILKKNKSSQSDHHDFEVLNSILSYLNPTVG